MKKWIIISIISCILISCIILFNVKIKDDDNIDLKESIGFSFDELDLNFEYNDDISLSEYVNNVDVKIENTVIDTSSLGLKSVNVVYSFQENEYFKQITYNIVDTTSPVLMVASSYSIEVGDEFVYSDYIIIGDNHDKKVECIILNDYDVNVVGVYELEIKCTDSSGNISSDDFKLNVVMELETSYYSADKVYLSDVILEHKTDNTSIGIDVSSWQGLIDYNKVKEAGVEFVMIRIGYESDNGDFIVDNYFNYNYENAKTAGLDVGVYFYSKSSTNEKAINQAAKIIELLDEDELELPIVFDWEIWNRFNSYNISLTDLNDMVDSFISYVSDHGYNGMNYGSANYLRHMFYREHDTWLAHYTTKTNYEYDYSMWQLTSTGVVDGVSGNVDINVLYK